MLELGQSQREETYGIHLGDGDRQINRRERTGRQMAREKRREEKMKNEEAGSSRAAKYMTPGNVLLPVHTSAQGSVISDIHCLSVFRI